MIIVEIIYNLSALIAASILAGFIKPEGKTLRRYLVLQGFIFGMASVLAMLQPLVFAPGLIFDGRSVMISLCGAFFGPLAVGVAVAMAIACRVFQGGVGALMGVLVILSSALLGLGFYILRFRFKVEATLFRLWMFGVLVHAVMLLLMLTLPSDMVWLVFKQMAFPVLFAYPLATILIGKVLLDMLEHKRTVVELRESHELFAQFMQYSPIYSFIKEVTPTHSRVVQASENFQMMVGIPGSEMVGKTMEELFPPEFAAKITTDDRAVIAKGDVIRFDEQLNGRSYTSIKFPIIQGDKTFLAGYTIDITESKKAEASLEKRLAALTRPLDQPDGITFEELFDLADIQRVQDEFAAATGVASIITYPDGTPITQPSNFCRLCKEIIRCTEKGRLNCYSSDARIGRYHPEGPVIQPCLSGGLWDAGASITVGDRHIANWLIGQVRDETQSEESMRAYIRTIGADEARAIEAFREVPSMPLERFKQIAQALFTLANQLSTTAYQNVQQARFITERKALESKLMTMAHYDTLTGLANRTLFLEAANMGIAHARRKARQCAILFIDLDHFKSVNDTLGHSVGDELLKDTAVRISSCIREEDMMARLGGDEFVVLLNDLESGQGAQYIAERIREKLNVPRIIAGNDLFITASTGIVVFPNDGQSIEDLLKNADTAMYAAKGAGRNTYCFFNATMNTNAVTKMQVERGLRDALVKKEFALFYQPIVRVADGRIRGFEALLRWFTTDGGLVFPNEFIPVAEDTGLIVPIGEWVLHEACRFNQQLVDAGYADMMVSVNISVAQLRRKNLVDVIKDALDQSGLRPELLEIEVTESLFIESFDAAIEVLGAISVLGVRVSLDDFGTGYSSLVHLQKLPIVNLKIDRLFINEIARDSDENAMIPAIIELAHKLKLGVIAEGVETEVQLEKLSGNRCDYYQGYLFSRPIPAAEVLPFLAQREKLI